jgi:NADPH:quinone reductase
VGGTGGGTTRQGDLASCRNAVRDSRGAAARRIDRATPHPRHRPPGVSAAPAHRSVGRVGHYFVELAASQGADITVVTASEERGARLVELGAAASLRRVADATGPYQIGLESVGGETTAAVWAKLSDDGLLVWFGQASRVPLTLDFFDWRGGLSGTIRKFAYTDSDTTDADDLATLVRLVCTGRLHPEIGIVADWEHTADVIEALVGRTVRGNAVLVLSSSSMTLANTPDRR